MSKQAEKVFYVKGTNNNSFHLVYGYPWSTHEGVYRSEMCWYPTPKDVTVIDADTHIAKRFIAEHDNNGNLLNIHCLSCEIVDKII